MLGAHLALTRYEVHIAVALHDVVLIAIAVVPAHLRHKIRDRTAESPFTTNTRHAMMLAFAFAPFGLFFGPSAFALPFLSPPCGCRSVAVVGVVGAVVCAFIHLVAAVAAVVAAASLQQAPLSAFTAGCTGGTSTTTTRA